MVTFPCKCCTDRHDSCHSNCERYLECKKKQQAEAKALHEWKKKHTVIKKGSWTGDSGQSRRKYK